MESRPKKDYKSLEKELEATQKQLDQLRLVFDNILESTMAGYWDWHIPENYEYLSPGFKKMFGYEDHELPNSPETWQNLIHPDDLPGVLDQFNEHVASKGASPYDNEVRYKHKDGSYVWVYCRGKVLDWDENDQPLRMVGSHINITALKDVEKLQRRNYELEQFAYVASHDLREPLNTVISFSDLLQNYYRDKLDENGQKMLGFLTRASGRMNTLIEGLLEYSRIGSLGSKEWINTKDLVFEVLEDLNDSIESKQAEITVDQLPAVLGIKSEIRSLFQNLISNAIKFQKDTEAPYISITAEQKNENWIFCVKDNGIGIEKNHYEKIFQIYQRLHSSHDFDGSGVGLARCKKIVETHGGRIWLDSSPNIGSSFYFTLS